MQPARLLLYLVTGGRTLQILNAKEEDAGRYTCVATNEAGETLKNYEVKVFGACENWATSPPFGVEEYNFLFVSYLYLFICFFLAVPPVINKNDIPGESLAPKEVKIKVNNTLTLECEAQAIPTPSLVWYKDGQVRDTYSIWQNYAVFHSYENFGGVLSFHSSVFISLRRFWKQMVTSLSQQMVV